MKRRTIFILSLCLASAAIAAPVAADAGAFSAPSAGAYTLLADTNLQRRSSGEADLHLNGQLTAAAEAKAEDMAAKDYWAHVSPSGEQPWDFISQSGYSYRGAGENLAYGFSSLDDVITGWMNSASHRANMLNSAFYDVGFAVLAVDNFRNSGPATLVVAEYGIPAVPPAAAPSPAPVAAAPVEQTVAAPAVAAPAPAPAPVVTSKPASKPPRRPAAHSRRPSAHPIFRYRLLGIDGAPAPEIEKLLTGGRVQALTSG